MQHRTFGVSSEVATLGLFGLAKKIFVRATHVSNSALHSRNKSFVQISTHYKHLIQKVMSAKSSSPTNSSNDYQVTVLDGTNYATWSVQMQAFLQSKGLSKFIKNNLEDLKARPNLTATKKMDLEDDDEKTLGHIKCNMNQSYWDIVAEATTAFDAWTSLKNFFSGKETFNKIHILEEYIDGRLSDEGDIVANVQKYIKSKNEAVRRLDSIGIKIEKDLQVAVLLARLPDSFDTMRRILESQNDVTMEQVSSELNREAIRKSNKRKAPVKENSFIADTDVIPPPPKKDTANNRSNQVCEICNVKGHSTARCWFNPKSSNYRPNFKEKILSAGKGDKK